MNDTASALEQHTQQFQVQTFTPRQPSLSAAIHTIPARLDSKTGEYFVLWNDVRSQIPTAERALNDDQQVLFVMDKNLKELSPQRIAYHPGMILDVVVTGTDGTLSSSALQRDIKTIISAQSQQTNNIRCALQLHLEDQVEKGRTLEHQQLRMKEQLRQLQTIFEKERHRRQMQALEQQQSMSKYLERKRQKLLRTHRDELQRLATIQNHIQAVLAHSYDLKDYPIPHLFIVLAKSPHTQSLFTVPDTHRFRLFFLCECGIHHTPGGSRTPQQIHLTKHGGYDIEKPSEFFQKYGPYVMAMMYMIKHGFAFRRRFVPPLGHGRAVEFIETVQSGLGLDHTNIQSIIDDSIDLILGWGNLGDTSWVHDQDKMHKPDKLAILNGADLRQLESYLYTRDLRGSLGDLRRVVAADGKVSWLCPEHHHTTYSESAMQEITDIVTASRGTIGDQCAIALHLVNRHETGHFYNVLRKLMGIQRLELSLGWNTTLEDLRNLATAVSSTSMAQLSVTGILGTPGWDLFNSSRQFNPLAQLLQSQQLQSLELTGFSGLFSQISVSAITMAPQLRTLTLGTDVNTQKKKELVNLSTILKACSALAKLTIGVADLNHTFDFLMYQIKHLPVLDTLKLAHRNCAVVTKLFAGEVEGVTMSVLGMSSIIPEHKMFLKRGILTRLLVLQYSAEISGGAWFDILVKNPKISEIKICCESYRAYELVAALTDARARIVAQKRFSALCALKLQHQGTTFISIDFHDNPVAILETIQTTLPDTMGPVVMKDLKTVGFQETSLNGTLKELLRLHGSTVERMIIEEPFPDETIATLHTAIKERGSSLIALRLVHVSLTATGFSHLKQIVDRSHDLSRFELWFPKLVTKEQQDHALMLTRQHATHVHDIQLHISSSDMLVRFMKAFPVRRSLPVLDSFSAFSDGVRLEPPVGTAEWIVELVSSPLQFRVSHLPPGYQLSACKGNKLDTDSWTPMKHISIRGLHFESAEWETIIRAIDFSVMETFCVEDTNFGMEQLLLLVKCIPDLRPRLTPLQSLRISKTKLDGYGSLQLALTKDVMATIRKKAPLAVLSLSAQ
ncbi:hypothetical protein EDD11_006548 [Mortierella claussenii]|nr:hypothetical protein EDD11_006548 [Mortierella claussenii]